TLSNDYVIDVDGKPIPTYEAVTHFHDKKYSFAYFDFSGQATVTIKTVRPLDHLAIRPDKYGFMATVHQGQATFVVDKPFSISFEPTGTDSPLELFGDSIDTDAPKPGEKNVVYFGPGIHQAGAINLRTGQTLYIAGGAVVHGAVSALGNNIRIMGHGILDGSEWNQRTAPADHLVDMYDGRNIVVRDLICRGAFHWTIVPQRCRNVTIDNVHLCGSRVGNDDGIDPCNCQDVTIENCFLRTDDDSIAIKGTTEGPDENIDIHDCTFWTEYANVFRIGYESRAPYLKHLTVRNVDVIHSLNPRNHGVQIFAIQPGGNEAMEDFLFENIRINGEFPQALAKIAPLNGSPGWGAGLGRPRKSTTEPYQENAPEASANGGRSRGLIPVPGDGPYIHNVVFRNIEVYGQPAGAPDAVIIGGLDAKRDVDNVTFDHVMRYGVLLTADSPGVRIGPFATHVTFTGGVSVTAPVTEPK
ncbi:MAG TPA: glycosyl hydrolase family 28 protein, partial [Tepidisphaeraceae bacterium]|nr:glycosyl hydrolase family 28 protein [Tepidisphaeraceae bacterium]